MQAKKRAKGIGFLNTLSRESLKHSTPQVSKCPMVGRYTPFVLDLGAGLRYW